MFATCVNQCEGVLWYVTQLDIKVELRAWSYISCDRDCLVGPIYVMGVQYKIQPDLSMFTTCVWQSEGVLRLVTELE